MTSVVSADVDQRLSDRDLRQLLLVRHFEMEVLRLFDLGEVHGTTHTCLGQEYVPVVVGALLGDDDYVLSNHRGHGHYLQRFDDPEGLLAEIMGRDGAVCRGVGGSQHILRGRYVSSGVLGECLPIACGIALRLRRVEPGSIACVYLGDGAWGEGAIYEALNIARLWNLPVLVIVENNGIAQSTEVRTAMAGTIERRAMSFDIPYRHLDGHDVPALRERVTPCVDHVRAGCGPMLVEFVTHRVGPHSKGDDSRSAESRVFAARHDWYVAAELNSDLRFAPFDAEARRRMAQVVRDVSARPRVDWMSE